MSLDWKQWEGQVIDGKFPLVRYLGGSEYSAVFLTELHHSEGSQKAAIKLVPSSGAHDDVQLSRWGAAAELVHPHLLALFDGGRCEIGGAPYVYLVMECAEENLAQILPSRALTPDEARVMLDSVLEVLAFLHGKGFVHSQIKPANVMANNDQLKLSSESIRRVGEALGRSGRRDEYDPPEQAPEAFTPVDRTSTASDVWALGMMIVETLTGTPVVTSATEQREPLVPLTLPEPFLDIARHCLLRQPQERWSVSQIVARLQGRVPAPQVRGLSSTPPSVAARTASLPVKRRSYGIPMTVGIVLALVALVAGPKLVRHHSQAAPDATALEKPVAPPATVASPSPSGITPAQHARLSEGPKPGIEKEGILQDRVAEPALAHAESLRGEATSAVAVLPSAGMVRGEVAKRVLPDVLESATATIRGTVRVIVKVDVDRSGTVEDAELDSRGPSRYFSRAALQAAQQWRFKPPMVGGRGVLSTWTLRFEFTRSGTLITPTQEIP